MHDMPMAALAAKRRRANARAHVRARGDGHAVLHRAAALCGRSTLPGRSRQRLRDRAPYAPFVDAGTARLRRHRSRPAIWFAVTLVARPDERAALRGGHRSASGGLRAGGVVVCDDRGLAQLATQRQAEQQGDVVDWWQRGGFDHVERHDDRVSCSRRGWRRAPRVLVPRSGDDGGHVQDRAGACRGDVRAGSVRPYRNRSSVEVTR